LYLGKVMCWYVCACVILAIIGIEKDMNEFNNNQYWTKQRVDISAMLLVISFQPRHQKLQNEIYY